MNEVTLPHLSAPVDCSVRPQDDFHQWVNGVWFRENPIPADKPGWGSFISLRDESIRRIQEIILSLTHLEEGSRTQEMRCIADFYASGMDEELIESLGADPIVSMLWAFGGCNNPKRRAIVLRDFHWGNLNALWRVTVEPDMKDSSVHILHLGQSGLGLPDREYYLDPNPKYCEVREKYVAHIDAMMSLAGLPVLLGRRILDLETQLAQASMPTEDLRNGEKVYHKMTREELSDLVPNMDWETYFFLWGVEVESCIVMQPDFLRKVNSLFDEFPSNVWEAYFQWRLLDGVAPYLSKVFVEEDFSFRGRILSGATEMMSREKRVATVVDNALGWAVGRLYAEKYFSESAREKIREMVDLGIGVFRDRIEELDWMDAETKAAARRKLEYFSVNLGYPDKEKWRTYTNLQIFPDEYLGNVLRANCFEMEYQFAKLNQPVDREEWEMTPQTVNACYCPLRNSLTFPLAIIQPPFFDESGHPALSCGAMLAIIFHEMTHPFDDSGSAHDEFGNLKLWWTDTSKENFTARTEEMVRQWNEEKIALGDPSGLSDVEWLPINGQLTCGENIADLGGVSLAYKAMQVYFEKHGRPAMEEGDLTPEQYFFIGWARTWGMQFRDEYLRRLVASDFHAPPKLRCNVTLSYIPEFHQAFGVQEGDGMYRAPEQRLEIW